MILNKKYENNIIHLVPANTNCMKTCVLTLLCQIHSNHILCSIHAISFQHRLPYSQPNGLFSLLFFRFYDYCSNSCFSIFPSIATRKYHRIYTHLYSLFFFFRCFFFILCLLLLLFCCFSCFIVLKDGFYSKTTTTIILFCFGSSKWWCIIISVYVCFFSFISSFSPNLSSSNPVSLCWCVCSYVQFFLLRHPSL